MGRTGRVGQAGRVGWVGWVTRVTTAVVALAAIVAAALTISAQALDGAAIFARDCASCHDGADRSRAPSPAVLRQRSPESILRALTAGGMRPQGGRLSGIERRASPNT